MSEQIEYAGFEASEFAENPDPRVPCVLLLDTSASMNTVVGDFDHATGETVMQDGQMYNVVSGGTTRIDLLNQGLLTLKETLAADSLARNCLPLGLAHGWKVLKPVRQGEVVRWSDVAFDAGNTAVRLRREMEASAASAAAPRAPAEIAR